MTVSVPMNIFAIGLQLMNGCDGSNKLLQAMYLLNSMFSLWDRRCKKATANVITTAFLLTSAGVWTRLRD